MNKEIYILSTKDHLLIDFLNSSIGEFDSDELVLEYYANSELEIHQIINRYFEEKEVRITRINVNFDTNHVDIEYQQGWNEELDLATFEITAFNSIKYFNSIK